MKPGRFVLAVSLMSLLVAAGCAQAPDVENVAGQSTSASTSTSSAGDAKSLASASAPAETASLPNPEATAEATTEPSEPTSPTSPTDVNEPSAAPDAGPDVSGLELTAFGEAFTWQDGIRVTVSKPKPFTPSDGSASRFTQHVQFEIALTNGTSARFDPTLTTDSLQSGDQDGEQVFDYAKGIEGAPQTALLPGRTAKWTVAYGVMDADDLVLEFAPDWDHDQAIFLHGSGKQDPATVKQPTGETPNSSPGEGMAYFGQTFTWEGGISLTFSSPKPFKRAADSGAGGEQFDHAVQFQVTVHNGSDSVIDPGMTSMNVQSGDRDGDQIFDSAAGLSGGPMTVLLPGRSARWTVAFGVDDPKDLVLEVNTDWEHGAAVFVLE